MTNASTVDKTLSTVNQTLQQLILPLFTRNTIFEQDALIPVLGLPEWN